MEDKKPNNENPKTDSKPKEQKPIDKEFMETLQKEKMKQVKNNEIVKK